jgi:predicted nucleic acid-binding protein
VVHVTFDTSALVEDWWLERAATRALLAQARRGKATLWIPEVVVAELVNKRSERLRAQWDKHAGASRAVGALMAPDRRGAWRAADVDFDADRADYERQLRQRLQQADVRIAPWPEVAHVDLVTRDLARSRPFKQNGSGYRDALIWETVKQIAEQHPGDDVILISTNNDDFAAPKSVELHPDLKAEAASVVLEPRLDAVVHRIDPLRRVFDQLRRRLDDDPDFKDQIEADIRRVVESGVPDDTSFINNPEATGARLLELQEITSVVLTGVLSFDDDTALVSFDVVAEIRAELTGPVPDGYDEEWPIEEEALLNFDGLLDLRSGEISGLQWAMLGV